MAKIYRSDFHTHTNLSYEDNISYGPRELVDQLAEKKIRIASITDHDVYTYSKELANYARKKGVFLIPGMEKTLKEIRKLRCW